MKNEIAIKLNESLALGYEANTLQGFEKAYKLAEATQTLKELLTPEYMKPIMQLQGTKLGFKTDKDNQTGYPETVVKNCLIEAVLTGVQPVNNQFNIIAGNCYITKEGFGFLLANYRGLSYEIIPLLPRISNDNQSAAIKMQINWSLNGGETKQREIEFPIKMNQYMGIDAVIGKATRKARAWLYNSISGLEVSDGDIQDIPVTVLSSKQTEFPENEIEKRVLKHIENSKTIGQLEQVASELTTDELKEKYNAKFSQISGKLL